MKILAIGNSFSEDATALIEALCGDIFVRNLYIGGCTLEQHCRMMDSDHSGYIYQQGGAACTSGMVTLRQGLESERWDYVTVQQQSGASGRESTYYPHITRLIQYIRRFSAAKIVFHQTWAYEEGCGLEEFGYYDNDRAKMSDCIRRATNAVCAREGLDVIAVGDLIERLREHDFFNVQRGGLSLTRDGFHLSYNYGRLAAAAAWIKFFTGKIPDCLRGDCLPVPHALIKKEVVNIN